MMIPFGEFAPDVAELDSGVAAVAKNVYPISNGYIPIKSLNAYSAALAAVPKGLFLFTNANGAFEQWACTTTKVYQLGGTAWTDRSGAKTFAVPAGDFMDATQFGPHAIFTNYTDGPYSINIDSGTNVAVLAGSPPTGRTIDVVNGHVMLGSTGADDYGVAWSDTNDQTNWSTGNSDTQSFKDGGRPRKICGAAGLVVQEHGVQRITFQPGDSKVFSFDLIEQAKGTIAPNSVIKFGPDIAYLAEDGFWFKGEPIGHERVARSFFKRANDSQIDQTQGVADPVRPLFYWMFQNDASSGVYREGFIYNWFLKKWAEVEFDLLYMSVIATPGVSPDSWTVSPDSEGISPDSRLWAGGSPTMSAFDTDKKLAFLDGTNMEATFETGEIAIGNALSEQQQKPGNRRAFIRTVRPDIDTSAAVMNVRSRERLADTPAWLPTEVPMTTSGNCYFHKGGRLFRFRVRVPSTTTWNYAKGIDVYANRGGLK